MSNYFFVPEPSPLPLPSPSDDHEQQPPRPRNKFMIYLAWKRSLNDMASAGQKKICSEVAKAWRAETPEVRSRFTKLAEEEKIAHKRQYPDYKFQPQKRKTKEPKRTARAKTLTELDKGEGSSKSAAQSSSSINPGRYHPYAVSRPHYAPYDSLLGPSLPMSAACLPSPSIPLSSAAGPSQALLYQVPQDVDWPSTNSFCGHPPNEISVGTMPSDSQQVDFREGFEDENPFDYDRSLGDGLQFDDTLLGYGLESDYAILDNAFDPHATQASMEGTFNLPPTVASQSSTGRVASSWLEYLQDMSDTLEAPV